MPLHAIQHYLVLTDDIEATKDFYCDALGMKVGFRPQLSFPGYWLYAGDVPCIHIGDWTLYEKFTAETGVPFSERANGTGPIDHIAFSASGFEEMRTQLAKAGVDYRQNELPDIDVRQIFVRDPNGVTIEMNFAAPVA